jgi:hypothetical protein
MSRSEHPSVLSHGHYIQDKIKVIRNESSEFYTTLCKCFSYLFLPSSLMIPPFSLSLFFYFIFPAELSEALIENNPLSLILLKREYK